MPVFVPSQLHYSCCKERPWSVFLCSSGTQSWACSAAMHTSKSNVVCPDTTGICSCPPFGFVLYIKKNQQHTVEFFVAVLFCLFLIKDFRCVWGKALDSINIFFPAWLNSKQLLECQVDRVQSVGNISSNLNTTLNFNGKLYLCLDLILGFPQCVVQWIHYD